MNKWIGTGRLTADPELRTTQSGKNVCTFKIACDRRFKKEGQPTADFFTCIAWGTTSQFVSKYFTKGKMIAIDGSLQNRDWTDNDNKKHYVTEIFVDNVEFCGDKGNTNKQSNDSDNNGYQTPTSGSDFAELDDDDGDLPF